MERLGRLLLVHRRLIAAACAGLAVFAAVSAIGSEPATVAAVVAARDLNSGHVLTAADLATVRLDAGTAPDHLSHDVVGLSVAGPMRSGEAFTDRRVVDPRDLGDDRVLAGVEVTRAVADVVRVGDRVDVVAARADTDTDASTVGSGLEVIAVTTRPDSATVAVAVDRATASALAVAAVSSRMTVHPVAMP